MNVALCKCGVDMSQHDGVFDWDDEIPDGGHAFDAAGTKYPCEEYIEVAGLGTFMCPRPMYHNQEGVGCGPLTGEKFW